MFAFSKDHTTAMEKIIFWPILKSDEDNSDRLERQEQEINKLINELIYFSLDKCTLLLFTHPYSIYAMNRLLIFHLINYSVTYSLSCLGHCWDPNEEYNLRKIIDSVSVAKFEETIRKIGSSLLETDEWKKVLDPEGQWSFANLIYLLPHVTYMLIT